MLLMEVYGHPAWVKKNTGQFIRGIGHGAFCTSTAGMDNWYFMGTRSISLVMKCSFLRPTKNSWTKNTVFQLDYFTVPLPSIVNRLPEIYDKIPIL